MPCVVTIDAAAAAFGDSFCVDVVLVLLMQIMFQAGPAIPPRAGLTVEQPGKGSGRSRTQAIEHGEKACIQSQG
jgi:hypothetical protein